MQANKQVSNRSKSVLSQETAIEIFLERDVTCLDRFAKCHEVALKYGVSPKTIRDIWNGRTWSRATQTLWTAADVQVFRGTEVKENESSSLYQSEMKCESDSKAESSFAAKTNRPVEASVEVDSKSLSSKNSRNSVLPAACRNTPSPNPSFSSSSSFSSTTSISQMASEEMQKLQQAYPEACSKEDNIMFPRMRLPNVEAAPDETGGSSSTIARQDHVLGGFEPDSRVARCRMCNRAGLNEDGDCSFCDFFNEVVLHVKNALR